MSMTLDQLDDDRQARSANEGTLVPLLPLTAPTTLTEQIAAYLSHAALRRRERGVDAYRRVLKRVAAYTDGHLLDASLVAGYLISRRGLAPTTIAAEMSVMASFGAWLRKHGYCDRDLLALVDRPRIPQGRDVLEAPKAAILCVVDWIHGSEGMARSRRFAALCLYAGLRITEARLLNWRSVDELAGELVVRADTAKWGRARRVPIAPPLAQLFAAVPQEKKVGAVAGLPDGHALTRGGAEHIFGRELPRFGIEVTAHQLRRAFATRLDELGTSVRVIQQLLGHSSLATTERYIGVEPGRKRDAIRGLDF